MSTNALYLKAFRYLYAGIIACLAVSGNIQGEVRKQWTIIPVEVSGEKVTYISDFAIGEEGVPWVALSTPHHTICYWQNGKWHKLAGNFTTGAYLARLYASPNGKVYLSQPCRGSYVRPTSDLKHHFGGLYLLEEGKATYVTDYYYEVSHNYPNLYFDKKDRIWNWGNRFIAKFEDGKWERIEASLGPCRIVEDTKGNVFFIGRKIISYYKDGIFKTDIKLPDMAYEMRNASFKCCLWGDDKVLFIYYGKRGAWVLDLKKLEVQNYSHRETALFDSALYDLFRDRQGNAWILAHNHKKAKNYFYIKVSAKDGKVEELLSTAAIEWDNHRNLQYPESVLCTSDGAIYFGPPGEGVYIFRNDQVSHIGWRQGLSLNSTDWVFEDKEGTIWFASRRKGIGVYDPKGTQAEEPPSHFMRTWKELPLACRALIKDLEGNIWCCLKDKPNTVSKWGVRDWEHFEVRTDTSKIKTFLVDDLNRLHLRMYDNASGVYRLSGSKVEHFRDLRDMLVDSVRTGSREFRSSNPRHILPPVVTKDKEIWYALSNYERFSHYDGIQWHQFNLSDDIWHIFKWKDDSVMIRTQGEKFFTLDKGQLVEFNNQHTLNQEYMLSECGIRLFDKAVYEANKGKFYPMRRTYKAIYLFENEDDFLDFTEDDIPSTAIKLSKYLDRIWLADGGFWAHEDNLPRLNRYYKGLMLNVDLATTPVGSILWAQQCDTVEDRTGNLWLRSRDTAFVIKQGLIDTAITIPKKLVYESRKLRIAFVGTSDGEESDKLRYCWRLDDGEWSEPSKKKYVEMNFAKSGFHNFEVMSIGEIGNVDTTPATLKLNIVIPLPEVRIVSTPDKLSEGPDIVVEYEVVKREEGSQLSFQWRLDNGKWHDTLDTKVFFSFLDDGKHVFEVRAVEDYKYIQPAPSKVEFVLKTDYHRLIARETERLKSASYSEREKAAATLVFIGERCLPYLRKELKQATRDTEWWFKNVIWQIEH